MRDFAILVGGAALPSFILIIWFYRLDHKRPEPVGLVGKSVLLGFLATIPAIFIEMIVDLPAGFLPGFLGIAWTSFVTAALVEEGIKYFVLKRWLFRQSAFDEIMDGIIYAVCLSLGFAFAENIMYGLGDGMALFLRAFTAVPLHATATGIMGYWFGMAKHHPAQAVPLMRRGFMAAVLVHGLYDFFLFTGTFLAFGALIVLAVAFKYLMALVKLAQAANDQVAYDQAAHDLSDRFLP